MLEISRPVPDFVIQGRKTWLFFVVLKWILQICRSVQWQRKFHFSIFLSSFLHKVILSSNCHYLSIAIFCTIVCLETEWNGMDFVIQKAWTSRCIWSRRIFCDHSQADILTRTCGLIHISQWEVRINY